jgi:hypothetical protein
VNLSDSVVVSLESKHFDLAFYVIPLFFQRGVGAKDAGWRIRFLRYHCDGTAEEE